MCRHLCVRVLVCVCVCVCVYVCVCSFPYKQKALYWTGAHLGSGGLDKSFVERPWTNATDIHTHTQTHTDTNTHKQPHTGMKREDLEFLFDCSLVRQANLNIPMGALRPGAGHPVKRREDTVDTVEVRQNKWHTHAHIHTQTDTRTHVHTYTRTHVHTHTHTHTHTHMVSSAPFFAWIIAKPVNWLFDSLIDWLINWMTDWLISPPQSRSRPRPQRQKRRRCCRAGWNFLVRLLTYQSCRMWRVNYDTSPRINTQVLRNTHIQTSSIATRWPRGPRHPHLHVYVDIYI